MPKKDSKKTKTVILPKKPKAMPTVELDLTVHDVTQHNQVAQFTDEGFYADFGKSSTWYKGWGNKCPVCKARANCVVVPLSEAPKVYKNLYKKELEEYYE